MKRYKEMSDKAKRVIKGAAVSGTVAVAAVALSPAGQFIYQAGGGGGGLPNHNELLGI
ncbi:hypothetical protein [Streptomyces chartreusis]